MHELYSDFPNLSSTPCNRTSDDTPSYNCIAWAMGDDTKWWWPDSFGQCYWPPEGERSETITAFIEMFATFGFEQVAESNLDQYQDQLALFTKGTKPTHAARKLHEGAWTSKLGEYIDFQHTLEGLAGGFYGNPTHFFGK